MGEFDSLQGTHEDVFHIGGPLAPRVERSGDVLKSTDKDGNLTQHQVGDPVNPQDAITKTYFEEILAETPEVALNCARNGNNVTDVWLRAPSGVPLNLSPFVLPYNLELIAISVRTRYSETWVARVFKNTDITSPPNPANEIASLSIAAANKGRVVLPSPVALNDQDEIAVYMDGTNISYPHVTLWFKRR